jgi:tetratricopeptide (TPR) repeat protein
MQCTHFGVRTSRPANQLLHRLPACFMAGVLAMFALIDPVNAQITTEQIIGDAVSEPNDARFSEVGEAIKRFSNNDLLGATTFLESARQKNKSLPPVNLMLAKMHYLSGNAQSGQASLEQAVTEDGTDPEPYLILGEQAFQAGQTIMADALFNRAVELSKAYSENPKRKRNFEIRARAGRASIAERRNNWAQAEADLRAWIEVEPDSANAYERLGQVLFMQDKAADGFKSFVEAHKLNEKLPNSLVASALMYDKLEKLLRHSKHSRRRTPRTRPMR